MSKHTEGPYLILDGTFIYALEEFRAPGGKTKKRNRFQVQVTGGPVTPREELEATTRLFAAAPELLANHERDLHSLSVIIDALGKGPLPEHRTALTHAKEMLAAKRLVIAKAEGK